ncbi:MAG: diguanylate cyclase [Myxococcales bacterium]
MITLITASTAILRHNRRRAADAAAWVRHTVLVLNTIQGIRASFSEVESSQRAYLITGDNAYLEAFDQKVAVIEAWVGDVKALVVDNLAQQERLASLQPPMTARVARLRQAIELRNHEAFGVVQQYVASGVGKREMDKALAVLSQMTAEEQRLLSDRDGAERREEVRYDRTLMALIASAAFLLLGGVWVTSREVVRRQRAVAERDRFFAMSLDMLCVAGMDGYFKWVNPAFEALGYSYDELTTRPFVDFVHPEDVAATIAEVDKLKQGIPTVSFENRYRHKDGTYRWIAWRTMPDPASGSLYATARDITEQKRTEKLLQQHAEQMQALSIVDELTQLNNRRGFIALATQHLRLAARNGKVATVLFLDLDGLKTINDELGHEQGDAAIKAFADVMRETFRAEDILARIGGDEYVALIVDCSDARFPLKRLFDRIASFNDRGSRLYRLSASTGTALFDPGATETIDVLLQRADAAMYDQKRSRPGRGRSLG